jgi:hypothetical protein
MFTSRESRRWWQRAQHFGQPETDVTDRFDAAKALGDVVERVGGGSRFHERRHARHATPAEILRIPLSLNVTARFENTLHFRKEPG